MFDQETIVYAEIDLAEIPKKRSSVNLTGTYNRWDILSLNVREQPYQPVVAMEELEARANGSAAAHLRELEERLRSLERLVASRE